MQRSLINISVVTILSWQAAFANSSLPQAQPKDWKAQVIWSAQDVRPAPASGGSSSAAQNEVRSADPDAIRDAAKPVLVATYGYCNIPSCRPKQNFVPEHVSPMPGGPGFNPISFLFDLLFG
jgi:hypothetical protein